MTHNYPRCDPLDWAALQPQFDHLLAAELTLANVRAWLQEWSDLAALLEEAGAQVYREITENTADESADARFRLFVTEILPAASKAEQALKQKWLGLAGYQPTAETAVLRRRFQVEAELFRDQNVPIISELHLLGKQYQEIIGGLSIEWQGEAQTIPQANVLLESPDRAQREAIWRRALQSFLSQRQALNDLFLEMAARRRRLAKNAGLNNFREYQWRALARFDYTADDCFTFHDAIAHEVVPLATELYQSLAADLGLAALRPWETGLEGPWGTTVDHHQTPIQAFDNVAALEEAAARVFRQVDPVFGDYFQTMRAGYLDLASRPNKAPGGYCNAFPVSGQPYIFMNAAGSAENVSTLMHEGGHAFHFAESSRRQSLIWNYSASTEFCEVASMGMELLSAPYWPISKGGFYSDFDARRALSEELRSTVYFLPYMAALDSFQHWLYVEAPEDVSAAELDQKWAELWDRYLPGIDYRGLQAEKESGWQRKGHVFGAPFYYVEYGLAQLGALQIWRNALADQSGAVAAYRSALALGYTRPLPELFAAAGARFAFDRPLLAELMALIREHL